MSITPGDLKKAAAEHKAAGAGSVKGSNPLDENPFNVYPGGCYFVNGSFVNANGEPMEVAIGEEVKVHIEEDRKKSER